MAMDETTRRVLLGPPHDEKEEEEIKVPEIKSGEKERTAIVRILVVAFLIILLAIGIIIPIKIGPSVIAFFLRKNTTSTTTPAMMATTTATTTIGVINETTNQNIGGASTSPLYSNAPATPYQPTNGTNQPQSGTAPRPYHPPANTYVPKTPADLAVYLVSYGTLDGSGHIIPGNTIRVGDRLGVQFNVRNTGGTVSAPWYFTVNLPTQDYSSQDYRSVSQSPLGAGSGIVSTVGTGNLVAGTANITITISPTGSDADQSNNTVQFPITIQQY